MSKILKVSLLTLLSFGVSIGVHADNKLKKLTDSELDHVAAGYLTIEVVAAAEAFGPVTRTYTVTDALVRQLGERKDGYIYTKGKGYAFAYAQGDEVATFVDSIIDTDEEIVSIKYQYLSQGTGRNRHNKNNKGNKNNANRNNNSYNRPRLAREKTRLIVRVTTRTQKK